jgi:excisionase family DNA binding protein
VSQPALLTEDEAAEALRVCPRTLRKERQAGKLPYILIGRRVLYSPTDIETFIERARATSQAPTKNISRSKTSANCKPGVIIPFSQRGAGR